MGWIETLNRKVAASFFGRYFQLDGSGHRRERKGSYFTTEIRAGLATFFAMAYIISVNATIVSDTGGTCVCNGGEDDPFCFENAEYALCKQAIRRDAVTGTAAICALASFTMGLFANMPVGVAPGMGLNAYFTYTVVGFNGTGPVPYRVALTAVFIEGWIFLGLTLLGLRQWLARAIPNTIKVATGVGIGLFLTLIGLTYSEGIGLTVGATATPLELAGCKPENRLEDGTCPGSDKMRNPTMWVGIFCSGFLSVFLMLYRVKGAIIIGIILVSIISWPRNTPVTYFPYTPLGDDSFNFFKRVVDFHPIENILAVQDWNIAGTGGQFGLALITFLYVDILDCTGTLYGMARFAGLIDPKTGDFEGSNWAFTVDSICCSISSVFGLPPVTAFVESGAGISEGGKTGLTAMVAGICFVISVFFAPIFASIPPWATGCVLILVGSMMTASVVDINWRYLGDAIPAFLTITLMPFTYSIADGLIGGICSYILINTVVWLIKLASRGKVLPPNYAEKEHWEHPKGGVAPVWARRLFEGKRDFWREDELTDAVTHKEEPVESKSPAAPEPSRGSDVVEPEGERTGDKVIKMS